MSESRSDPPSQLPSRARKARTRGLQPSVLIQSKTISRVMSCVIIYPMELSPVPFSDPPENMTGSHIRFLFGLASDGVYMASSVTRETVVSYTAFPPLPEKSKIPLAVSLCCTIPGVTSAGRYPAPCPAKPGLSSPGPFRSCQPRLHILLRHKTEHQTVNNHITKLPYCPSPNLRNTLRESYTSKQLPPTNSLRIEFFGISSIGTPTK